IDRPRQRLFAINVFAHANGSGGDDRVVVIRRADHDGLDALFLVEHLAEILVLFRAGILLESLRGVIEVHVAQGDDVFTVELFEVPAALATDAYSSDVEFAVGRGFARPAQYCGSKDHEGGEGRGAAEEIAAR